MHTLTSKRYTKACIYLLVVLSFCCAGGGSGVEGNGIYATGYMTLCAGLEPLGGKQNAIQRLQISRVPLDR